MRKVIRFCVQHAIHPTGAEMVMNKNMCHGALQNILKIYIGQSRKSCYQLLRMDAKQARLVLGLRPGEDWRDHQLAFWLAYNEADQ